MQNLSILAQIVIAVSIAIVWVGRSENIAKEFEEFGLSSRLRNFVGATKISLATLLVAGIWYPALVPVPAIVMALLMICAALMHYKIKNPLVKFLPSLSLLMLSVFVAAFHLGIVS